MSSKTDSRPNKGKNRTYYILPRFSLQPVLDYLEGNDAWDQHPDKGGTQPNENYAVRFAYVARRTGVSKQTVIRWNSEGVDLYKADKIAVSLGKHPAMFWPDWYSAEIKTEVR